MCSSAGPSFSCTLIRPTADPLLDPRHYVVFGVPNASGRQLHLGWEVIARGQPVIGGLREAADLAKFRDAQYAIHDANSMKAIVPTWYAELPINKSHLSNTSAGSFYPSLRDHRAFPRQRHHAADAEFG